MAFARYEKLDLIGRSHIGEVWRCLDSKHRRTVAALQLTGQIAEVSSWDEAWVNVLRYFRDFRHEYVVQAIDTDPEQRLVLMELMADSMRSLLKQRERIQPDRVRRCLRRCLEALAELHPRSLIHGDIRPDQLLFNAEGRFRLSFSIGLRPGGVVIRRENFNEYFAPELLNPAAGPVGHQVDLYALGIAAYEMLVGSGRLRQLVPGVGENSPEPQKQWMKWQADLSGELPKLTKIFGNVPPDLAAVIDGLVKKRTSERFATADEALALLETEDVVDDILVPVAELAKSGESAFTGPAAVLTDGVASSYRQSDPGPAAPGRPAFPPHSEAERTVTPDRSAGRGDGNPAAVRPLGPVAAPPPPPRRARPESGGRPSRRKRLLVPLASLAIVIAALGSYACWDGLLPWAPKRGTTGDNSASRPRELTGTLDPPDAKLTAGNAAVTVAKGAWTWAATEAGPVTLKAEHNGYVVWTRTIGPDEKGPIAIVLARVSTTDPKRPPVVAARPNPVPTGPALQLAGTVEPPDAVLTLNESPIAVESGSWNWSSPRAVEVTLVARKEGYQEATFSLPAGEPPTLPIALVLKRLQAVELTGTVSPPDARVAINDELIETKGGRWQWSSVEPTVATLTVARDGYEPWSEALPSTGRHTISVELERSPAIALNGTLTPPDALLTINGVAVPVADGRWSWSSPDAVQVTLRAGRDGYEPWKETLSSTGRVTLPVALQRIPAMRLEGTLDPPDAKLTVNGRPVEVAAGVWKWSSTNPVDVTLRASREGYSEWTETFGGKKQANGPIAVSLERLPAMELAGTLDPPDAALTINNDRVEVAGGKWEWSSTAEQPAVMHAHHPKFADWRYTVARTGRSTLAVLLDPLVTVTPPDATVTVDGAKVAVDEGKAIIGVAPRAKVRISLSKDGNVKTFDVTRESLAELNYALTLPVRPSPAPEPATAPDPLVAEFDAATARAAQEAWAKSVGTSAFEKNSIGMVLALIPPGRFTIGRDPKDPSRGNAVAAQPAVVDRPFAISTTEVTQAQWVRVMETRPWAPHGVTVGDDCPAVYIDCDDADEFCRRLTALEAAAGKTKAGWLYRLPTEVEWEWACRAGSNGRYTCPEAEIERYGWFERNVGEDANIRRVAQLAANRFGLFDVHGNAAEWCGDIFISKVEADDAPAPGKAVLRGGGWNRTATHISSASRDAFPRDKKASSSGFRIVRAR